MGSTTLGPDRPIKERQICSRRGLTIRIKEVIGAGIILVHGLLDEAQPQRFGVETLVAWCVGGNRRQMVDAGQLHGSAPSLRVVSHIEPATRAVKVAGTVHPVRNKRTTLLLWARDCRLEPVRGFAIP